MGCLFRHQHGNMFRGATAFNGDISNGICLPSPQRFYVLDATAFNGDISEWERLFRHRYGSCSIGNFGSDISNGTSLLSPCIYVLAEATAFNGDISKWDVSLYFMNYICSMRRRSMAIFRMECLFRHCELICFRDDGFWQYVVLGLWRVY
jgi:hypothetical protein